MNIASLPKAELHCHLDGVLDRAMLHQIREADPTFPIDPAVFEQAYPVHNFDTFLRWWQFCQPIYGQLPRYYPILRAHIERLKTEGVRYTELMIPSGSLPRQPAQAVEAMTALRAFGDQFESDAFQAEFIICIGRGKTPEEFAAVAERVLALKQAGLIVGVAVAGIEMGNPVRPYQQTMARFREAGLGIEIHAGEWVGAESVWDALEYGFPNRIGHGVSLFADPRLVEVVQQRGLHIELCPTSNLKTGSIASLSVHPIGQAAALGLSFSINTDDPGIFENSMSLEYQRLADTFDFGEAYFQRVFQQSLEARFRSM